MVGPVNRCHLTQTVVAADLDTGAETVHTQVSSSVSKRYNIHLVVSELIN